MTNREQLVFNHLSQFVSDHKKQFVEKVLAARTRHITVVLEDIFQSQNASAVIRTCECMGIQDIHMVENITQYSLNPRVLKGSNKWIDIFHHRSKNTNNTEAVFRQLKEMGYKLVTWRTIGRTELIKILPDGTREGAADIRGDDSVSGY